MSTTRLVAVAILLSFAAPIWAEEAEDAFNQLYGDDLKRVLATSTPADDIALARQLLDAAQRAEKQPALFALLCGKTYDLAAKDASGYPTATAAMDLLAEKVPEKKVEALQKTAALYQKQYAAARADTKAKAGEALIVALTRVAEAQAAAQDIDGASAALKQAITVATAIKSDQKAALRAQLEGLAPAHKMEKQIAALEAKLEQTPADAASRKELVRLLLVEKDNPAEAAKFVDGSLDEATRKYVPAAAKPMEEAPELACKELGEWYRGLADGAATLASKGAMLCRAQGYYERFLDLHKDEDLARTTATLMLKKIEDALAKLPAPKAAAMAWVDCLKLVDPARNTVKGKWQLRNGQLFGTERSGQCHLSLPIVLTQSYEVQATVARTAGDDALILGLPAGKGACTLSLSDDQGAWHRLELIDGQRLNVRPGALALVSGQEYVVGVKVFLRGEDAEIVATLDGKPLLEWRGRQTSLSTHPNWASPDPRCLGVGTWLAEAVFRRIRVRALPHDARSAVEAPAPKPKG